MEGEENERRRLFSVAGKGQSDENGSATCVGSTFSDEMAMMAAGCTVTLSGFRSRGKATFPDRSGGRFPSTPIPFHVAATLELAKNPIFLHNDWPASATHQGDENGVTRTDVAVPAREFRLLTSPILLTF